ncbi:type I toxin-antitoxin system Fst family toxin [Listeria grandensis]|nr:type I toxin-antitoxin system Fst family toxin [Listeria grandensis]
MILIFSTLIAPILVGMTLMTYKYWLEHRKRERPQRRSKF